MHSNGTFMKHLEVKKIQMHLCGGTIVLLNIYFLHIFLKVRGESAVTYVYKCLSITLKKMILHFFKVRWLQTIYFNYI